jgi:hypothetical protein
MVASITRIQSPLNLLIYLKVKSKSKAVPVTSRGTKRRMPLRGNMLSELQGMEIKKFKRWQTAGTNFCVTESNYNAQRYLIQVC